MTEVQVLKKHPIFSSLNYQQIERFIAKIPKKSFSQQEHLIHQGKKESPLYILTEGRVGVYTQDLFGKKSSLVVLEAPSLIGEMEIWMEYPSLSTVTALEPCSTFVIKRSLFLELLQWNHQLCINLIRILSEQLYQDATLMRLRTLGTSDHLLAHTLVRFAKEEGEKRECGILLRKKGINKTELAERMGISRRSVIHAFQHLQELGLIQASKNLIIIPSLPDLQKKAQEPFAKKI